ncbi:MAG: hypothetical protein ABSG75_08230 [Syntrophales bacterium]
MEELGHRWSLPSNSVASAFPAACCGVSERMVNDYSLRIEDSPQLAAEIFNVLVGGGKDRISYKVKCKRKKEQGLPRHRVPRNDGKTGFSPARE